MAPTISSTRSESPDPFPLPSAKKLRFPFGLTEASCASIAPRATAARGTPRRAASTRSRRSRPSGSRMVTCRTRRVYGPVMTEERPILRDKPGLPAPHWNMPSDAFDLSTTYAHLGLGARVIPLPDFAWTPEYLERYTHETESDGDDGRLVTISPSEVTWTTWERHPAGEELVVQLAGSATLFQEIDGSVHAVELVSGWPWSTRRGSGTPSTCTSRGGACSSPRARRPSTGPADSAQGDLDDHRGVVGGLLALAGVPVDQNRRRAFRQRVRRAAPGRCASRGPGGSRRPGSPTTRTRRPRRGADARRPRGRGRGSPPGPLRSASLRVRHADEVRPGPRRLGRRGRC